MSYINCHYYNQELDKECHTFSQIPANRYGAGLMVTILLMRKLKPRITQPISSCTGIQTQTCMTAEL